jgi:hypothetical protein
MEQLARHWLSEGGVSSMTSVIETCRLASGASRDQNRIFRIQNGDSIGLYGD